MNLVAGNDARLRDHVSSRDCPMGVYCDVTRGTYVQVDTIYIDDLNNYNTVRYVAFTVAYGQLCAV